MAEQTSSTDTAVRMSHRHLTVALGLVLLLGGGAMLSIVFGGTPRPGALWILLPMFIAIAAAALRGTSKGVDADALKAMRNDELRQASLQHAWRVGFFVVLALQPVLVWAVSYSAIANGPALMACGTVTIGAAVMLASLLWYDR
jgi:hypothetical protein